MGKGRPAWLARSGRPTLRITSGGLNCKARQEVCAGGVPVPYEAIWVRGTVLPRGDKRMDRGVCVSSVTASPVAKSGAGERFEPLPAPLVIASGGTRLPGLLIIHQASTLRGCAILET